MAELDISVTVSNGQTSDASFWNTPYSEIETWLNNRYNGTDTWLNMKVSATAANPVDIVSSAGTTELSLNNTATDGDPLLTFKLSGSQTHVIGVDDSDSDYLKFATTGITSNVAMQIPTGGAAVEFADGSAGSPSITNIGDTNTGAYFSGADTFAITTGGTLRLSITTAAINSTLVLNGPDGSAASPTYSFSSSGNEDTGMFRSSDNVIGFSAGGTESMRINNTVAAGEIRLVVYDVSAAALVQVTRGAADSGGSGFRLLRIPN